MITLKKLRTRGRKKTTGTGELIGVRLHTPLLTVLDDWIDGHDPTLSRPEAIRRILAAALKLKAATL